MGQGGSRAASGRHPARASPVLIDERANQLEEPAARSSEPALLRSEGVTWQNYELDSLGSSLLAWQIRSGLVEYGRDVTRGSASDLVGEIFMKGAVAYKFLSQKALVREGGGTINVEGRVYVQDLVSGLQLRGEAMTWTPASQTLRLHGGVAACRGSSFWLRAPALSLVSTIAAAPLKADSSRFEVTKGPPKTRAFLGLLAPKGFTGMVKVEGPAHAWIVSPSTIIGGMQGAQKEARRIVSKLVAAPAVVSRPLTVKTEKPNLTQQVEHGDTLALEHNSPAGRSWGNRSESQKRSRQGRPSVEIQIEAEDGLSWDLSSDALASNGSISVWCNKVPDRPR